MTQIENLLVTGHQDLRSDWTKYSVSWSDHWQHSPGGATKLETVITRFKISPQSKFSSWMETHQQATVNNFPFLPEKLILDMSSRTSKNNSACFLSTGRENLGTTHPSLPNSTGSFLTNGTASYVVLFLLEKNILFLPICPKNPTWKFHANGKHTPYLWSTVYEILIIWMPSISLEAKPLVESVQRYISDLNDIFSVYHLCELKILDLWVV